MKIISPGALAGGLTEEDIRNGKTYQRNPYLAVFATNALHYKGIGSGIVRILAECPNIQLSNDDRAKEFKVTIWRTIQKSDFTIQKKNSTIQKSDFTIQKKNSTIQKSDFTIQKELGSNFAKVLNYLKEHPAATVNEAANSIDGISLGGVKLIIRKLKEKGLLKRIGGRKLGEWQVQEQGTNEIRLGEE